MAECLKEITDFVAADFQDFDFSIFDDDITVCSQETELKITSEMIDAGNSSSMKDTDCGSRMRRKAFRRRGQIDNNSVVNSVLYRKELRRKTTGARGFKLYAFPSFDRSDALLFLPTTFATYFNSADSPALSKLMCSHVTKSCQVNVNILADESISTKSFLQFYDLMRDINPDIIMCVTSTKVVENQIRSDIVMKFTACKAIYESVGRRLKGTFFEAKFGPDRYETIKRSLSREELKNEDRHRFQQIADTDLDLVLHTKAEMVLTVDNLTKKVTHMRISGGLTSMEAVQKE